MTNSAQMMNKMAEMASTWKLKMLQDANKFNFKCTECGKCCNHIDILLSPYDVYKLARWLNKTVLQLIDEEVISIHRGNSSNMPMAMLKQAESGPCEFLKDNKCSIHEFRPKICRLYPLGAVQGFDTKTGEMTSGYAEIPGLTEKECEGIGKWEQTLGEFKERANLNSYNEPGRIWYSAMMKWVTGYSLDKMNKEDFNYLCSLVFESYDVMISAMNEEWIEAEPGVDIEKVILVVLEKKITEFFNSKPYLTKPTDYESL